MQLRLFCIRALITIGCKQWFVIFLYMYHRVSYVSYVSYIMLLWTVWLTHWGRVKMAAIFQTTISDRFSFREMYDFRLQFHWSLFRLTNQTTSHYLKQWWLVCWRVYVSLGLNELNYLCLFAHRTTFNYLITAAVWRSRQHAALHTNGSIIEEPRLACFDKVQTASVTRNSNIASKEKLPIFREPLTRYQRRAFVWK